METFTKNAASDADFIRVKYAKIKGAEVHRGFYNVYKRHKDAIKASVEKLLGVHEDYSILVTGHSLGKKNNIFTF